MPDDAVPPAPLFRLEALLAANQPFRGERTRLVPVPLQASVGTVAALLIACAVIVARMETTDRAIVEGELVPVDGTVAVVVARPGVIDALFVAEGQLVAKRERLARVAEADWFEGQPVASALEASLARRADQLAAQRRRLVDARDAAVRDVETRVAHLEAQRSVTQQLVEIQRRRLHFAERRFDRVGMPEERGFLSAYAYGELRDGVLARAQAVTEGELAQHRTTEQRDAARQTGRRRVEQLDGEIAAVDLELSRIDDQRLREAVRGSYEIVAPRAGIVVGLEEVVGDTVVPGQTLLGLVSDGAVLKARLYARTDSAARLAEGLDVALRVGAFPYQKHGTLAGVVERVSMATVLPERSVIGHNAGVPLYVLDVRLASQTVTDGDRERPLKPGMEVTAELILDRRRLGRRLRDALTAL